MDDNRFDKKIKEKLYSYQEDGYDSQALASFRRMMQDVSTHQVWYKNTVMMRWLVAALAVLALSNYFTYAYFQKQNQDTIQEQIAILQGEYEKLYALKSQASSSENQVDTVYIDRYRNVPNLNTQIAKNEQAMGQFFSDDRQAIYQFLLKNGYFNNSMSTGTNEYSRNSNISPILSIGFDFNNAYFPANSQTIAGIENINENKLPEEKTQSRKWISSRVLKSLAKQQMHGLGWTVGPELNTFKTSYDVGTGQLSISPGIKVEAILSPSWRIESGLSYSYLDYFVSHETIQNLDRKKLESYPVLSDNLGDLTKIGIDRETISVPLIIKYFHPVSESKKFYFSGGISTSLHLFEKFEHIYDITLDNVETQIPLNLSVETEKVYHSNRFQWDNIQFGIGLESNLKPGLFLQTGFFYQKSLSRIGQENTHLSLIGINSSLRFRLK